MTGNEIIRFCGISNKNANADTWQNTPSNAFCGISYHLPYCRGRTSRACTPPWTPTCENLSFRLWIWISGRSSFGSSGSGILLICSHNRINNDSALFEDNSSSSRSAFNARLSHEEVKPANDVVTVNAAGGRSDGDCDILKYSGSGIRPDDLVR